jgi:hypothetical protein
MYSIVTMTRPATPVRCSAYHQLTRDRSPQRGIHHRLLMRHDESFSQNMLIDVDTSE